MGVLGTRRVLIFGVSSPWGGRLAQRLERDPGIEAVLGIDSRDPQHELQRTEFIRIDAQPALLRRILDAAAIDTVFDTRLVPDYAGAQTGVDLSGTVALLSACGGPNSTVEKLVVKSSDAVYGSEPDDPAFFTEEMSAGRRSRVPAERDLARAESAVQEFARHNPKVATTVLRMAAALGDDVVAPHMDLLSLPVVPGILGFDPRFQFIHEDDVVGVLEFAAHQHLPGIFNAAADGVLVLSEVVSTLGKPLLPLLPPWATNFAAAQLRRVGVPLGAETVRDLRYGRGLDNRRLKAEGFGYRYTTREAVVRLRSNQRLRPMLRSGREPYEYHREVEEFLRWSPSVRSAPRRDGSHAGAEKSPLGALGDLTEHELIDLIPSLEASALAALRAYEADGRARTEVIAALDRAIERRA